MHQWGWLKSTFLSAKPLNDIGPGAYLDSRVLDFRFGTEWRVVIRPPIIHGTLHFIIIS